MAAKFEIMINLNSKKIVVYAINEDCNGLVYLKMFDYPEQEKEAQQAFDDLLPHSEYDSRMCTQEHFAKLITEGQKAANGA